MTLPVSILAVVHPTALLGVGTTVGPFCVIGEGVVIGRDCTIGASTEIRAGCVIGDRVRFGSMCLVAEGTTIGDDCHLSGRFTTCNKPKPGEHEPAVIADNVYAGVGVTIMPGVLVGAGAVLGARALVMGDVGERSVWFGSPAKWHRDLGGRFDCCPAVGDLRA